MPAVPLDICGQRYGRLVVVSLVDGPSPRQWICQCDCGITKTVRGTHLRSGATLSCGCYRDEIAGARFSASNFVHGQLSNGTRPPEYRCWSSLKDRCLNPNNANYPDYGGRGIDVDPRWIDSFETFLSEVGPRPSDRYSIDRINNDGGYWPHNVRWATKTEQARNRRAINRSH